MKKELELEDLKRIQLEILEDVDFFCRDNNLKYSLAYGTLLGAVRHKGFIPWDDDIDIMMPRGDYQKFMETYASDRFQKRFQYGESGILLPFGKVYDTQTELIENVNHSDSPGVFIDIFPIDKEPIDPVLRNKIRNRLKRLFRLKVIKSVRLNRNRNSSRNLVLLVLKTFTSFISYSSILRDINRSITKAAVADSVSLIDYNDFNNDALKFSPDTFESLISLDFEGRKFMAIKNYNEVLRMMYGDYMKLPPKEKQVTHHDYIAYLK